MGGRKLARYVLEAVVSLRRLSNTAYHFSARDVKYAFDSRLCRPWLTLALSVCFYRLGGCACGDCPPTIFGPWRPTYATRNDGALARVDQSSRFRPPFF